MVFEGIVINKVPYKERDLIVKLLLRGGTVGSFYVYGGQGGGKNHKPTIYELGSMMKVQIKPKRASRGEDADLMVASESQRTWEPQKVRHNVHAYYLMCLYLEIIQKFSMPFQEGSSEFANDHEGIFLTVSNAIFYLNDALDKEKFEPSQHLCLFMIKLLHHLGIMPDTETCSYCSGKLMEASGVSFIPANGQFACLSCAAGEDDRGFLLRVKKGYQTKFQEYDQLTGTRFQEADKLIQFFCHHFQLRPLELKTYSLLLRK